MHPPTLRLKQSQLDAIVAQARRSPGSEVCGLLGGQGAEVRQVYPVPNASPTPAVRFLMDGQPLVSAMLDIEARGWELVAVYHSHPAGVDAIPSPTDVANANYPEALNLIVSFDGRGEPVMRVFQIGDGLVREAELEIVGVEP